MTGEPFGHVLDMLGECNATHGPVTVSGMGASSARVTVTADDGRTYLRATAPTLTLALESLRRKVRKVRQS